MTTKREILGELKKHKVRFLRLMFTDIMGGIKNVEVALDDGVANVCGDCDNQAIKDRAILLAGNIQGVERVVADGLHAPDPKPEDEAIQDAVYEIKSGDTLGAVAKHFYGKASLYTRIFEANRDIVDDPNTIYPGQKIRIPLD